MATLTEKTVDNGDGTYSKGVAVQGSSIWTPADAPLTRPNNATPTVIYGAIGASANVLFTFTDFFEAIGAHELLTGMRLTISKASIAIPSGIAIRAHLYNADPTATALSSNADAATFKTMEASAASKLGYVDFASFSIGGTGSDLIEAYGVPVLDPMHLKAAAAARNLYALIVASAVYTPVAQSVHTLYASRASL